VANKNISLKQLDQVSCNGSQGTVVGNGQCPIPQICGAGQNPRPTNVSFFRYY